MSRCHSNMVACYIQWCYCKCSNIIYINVEHVHNYKRSAWWIVTDLSNNTFFLVTVTLSFTLSYFLYISSSSSCHVTPYAAVYSLCITLQFIYFVLYSLLEIWASYSSEYWECHQGCDAMESAGFSITWYWHFTFALKYEAVFSSETPVLTYWLRCTTCQQSNVNTLSVW